MSYLRKLGKEGPREVSKEGRRATVQPTRIVGLPSVALVLDVPKAVSVVKARDQEGVLS